MPSPNKATISTLLLPPLTAIATAFFSLLLFLTTPFCKITRTRRTVLSDSKPPHRFSYSTLRRATDSFSPSHLVGRGGFGSVYRGTLPHTQKEIAVKLLDSGSLQGEREFQNELFFAAKIDSPFIVSVFGFCSDKKQRRMMMLVYDLMENKDALLRRKCVELMEWKTRFSVALDIAKGLEYLHGLDPPIIHGDIKPSNVLLDRCFEARIGDFGLARLRSERNSAQYEVAVKVDFNGGGGLEKEEEKKKKKKKKVDELKSVNGGSVAEFETESVATTIGFEEIDINVAVDQSPDNSVSITILETSSEKVEETGPLMSLESVMALEGKKDGNLVKSRSRRDWGWQQETAVKGESGSVKNYVMEWIGSEISHEKPTSDWIGASTSSSLVSGKMEKNSKKRMEWWMTMDEEKNPKNVRYEKRRQVPPREWWKEEYCEELAKKKKNKKTKKNQFKEMISCDEKEDEFWPVSEELYRERKKIAKSRRRGSWSSIDWLLDGLSSELRKARRHSYDSSDIPQSGISSTPSMRGTMCYIAPEYGIGGDLSEKCDVYSFGVLLLVVVAGRKPFQLTNSPSLEFRHANLISWARYLARSGKLFELVDRSIESLDLEQALLSITIALLCLQKFPDRRPSMKEVVGMLTSKLGPPQLPSELSPSRFSAKSHGKVR